MLALKVKYNGNWEQLDLYGDESVKFNKSVIEVQNFTARTSAFTKLFRIPGTSLNNKILGHIFKINVEDSSFDPKGKLEAAITINGRIIIIGSLRLERLFLGLDRVDYEVTVYSQLGDLASKIKDISLCDVDFTSLNHDLTYQNVTNSWNLNLKNGDVVYPFIHYGLDDDDLIPDLSFTNTIYSFDNPNKPLPFWYYKPAVRVRRIVEDILNDAGYELESEFMNTDFFNNLYMPLSFSNEFGVQTNIDNSLNARVSTDLLNPSGNPVIFDDEISDVGDNYDETTGVYTLSQEGKYKFRAIFKYDLSNVECNSPTKNNMIIDYGHITNWSSSPFDTQEFCGQVGTFNYNFEVNYDYDFWAPPNPATTRVIFKKRYQTDCREYEVSAGTSGSEYTYNDCNGDPQSITVSTGTETIFAIENSVTLDTGNGTITDVGIAPNVTGDLIIKEDTELICYESPTEPDGSTVIISQNMPCDVKQIDFLKSIFTYFNMVVYGIDDDETTLKIEPWVNWVNDPDVEVRDWTEYLDTSKDVIVQPLVDNENRYVNLSDLEDTDTINKFHQQNYNSVYGDKLFDANSDIVNDTVDVETIFSPTPTKQLEGSVYMIVPQLYEQDDAGNKKPFKTNPRILYYNGQLPIGDTYYVRDTENDTTHAHTTYPCMSGFERLNTPSPNTDSKTLQWDETFAYYSPLTNYNTFNAKGTLYNLYWKEYFVDTYDSDSRFVTAFFNIPYDEFIDTKLNDRIRISGMFGNTEWRINRISDYDLIEPSTTKVELIKVIGSPEVVDGSVVYDIVTTTTTASPTTTTTTTEFGGGGGGSSS
jgi:hypothetical protein